MFLMNNINKMESVESSLQYLFWNENVIKKEDTKKY